MVEKGTVAAILEVAKAEVGTIEGPKDNETKYGAFTKANFLPWCGSYVMWCAAQAGVKVPNTVSTVAGAAAFKKMGTWFEADCGQSPQPGDILYFDFPGDGVDRISHVGICKSIKSDGVVYAYEGNTSGKKKGSQRNGGEVCEQVRLADGDYGPATKKAVIAFQDNHDVVDSNGIIGPKTWAELVKFL